MLDKNLWGEFELIEVNPTTCERGFLTISSDKKQMNISTKFIKELDWQDKQRLNLYRFGETFALKTDKVGLITLHRVKNGGTITSANFCLEVLSRTHSCRKFEGWVEEGILFFKPAEGEEK